MKFLVEKTSDRLCSDEYYKNNPPCNGLKWEYLGSYYRSCFKKHADEYGWVVELNSLEELNEFRKKQAEILEIDAKIVIKDDYRFEDLAVIEIYDDYRE